MCVYVDVDVVVVVDDDDDDACAPDVVSASNQIKTANHGKSRRIMK
jgi:hypothetical protein